MIPQFRIIQVAACFKDGVKVGLNHDEAHDLETDEKNLKIDTHFQIDFYKKQTEFINPPTKCKLPGWNR